MFKKLTEMPIFQQALKDVKAGKTIEALKPTMRVEPLWVKKLVSPREWKSHYSQLSYCFLRKEQEGVWIGFEVANVIRNGNPQYQTGTCPDNCDFMTDEEMYQVDEYRRSHNIYPTPLKEAPDSPAPLL